MCIVVYRVLLKGIPNLIQNLLNLLSSFMQHNVRMDMIHVCADLKFIN